MFRGLVIVLEIVVLLFLLRSPFVQYFFADVQKDLSDWLVELSQIPEKAELNELKSRINPNIQAMKPFQKDYLFGVMNSRESVNHFHQLYCIKGDKNPYVYGASLRYVCSEISSTSLIGAGSN